MMRKGDQTLENLYEKTIKGSLILEYNMHLEMGLSIREYLWKMYGKHAIHFTTREEYFEMINGEHLFELQFRTRRKQEVPFYFAHMSLDKILKEAFDTVWIEAYARRHKDTLIALHPQLESRLK